MIFDSRNRGPAPSARFAWRVEGEVFTKVGPIVGASKKCRMYVKTFRYRVLAAAEGRFRDVQRRVAEIYEQRFGQDVIYLQNAARPLEWLEIHIYADADAADRLNEQMAALPEATALWREFEATLDPAYPAVVEEFEQRHWLAGTENRPADLNEDVGPPYSADAERPGSPPPERPPGGYSL